MAVVAKQRGAPSGNKNAYKHGFYSRAFRKSERKAIRGPIKGQLEDEGNLLRVLIADVAEDMKTVHSRALSFRQSIDALRVVSMAVARLISLLSTSAKLYADSDELEEFFKKLESSDDEILNDNEMEAEQLGKGRGAQPGNINALKHGYYASAFSPEELRRLDGLDGHEIDQEMSLLRALIKRSWEARRGETGAPLSLDDKLFACRTIIIAVSCVEKLERLNRLVFALPSEVEKYIEKGLDLARKDLGVEDYLNPNAKPRKSKFSPELEKVNRKL